MFRLSRSLCSLSLFLSHARARVLSLSLSLSLSLFRFVNLTDFKGAKKTLETMVAAGVPADAVTYTAYMKMLVPMKRDVPIHFQEGTWKHVWVCVVMCACREWVEEERARRRIDCGGTVSSGVYTAKPNPNPPSSHHRP